MGEREGERSGGSELPKFAQKVASSDGFVYAIDEAEKQDLRYLVENSCLMCNKMLPKSAVRVLPTRYIQERDAYVRSGFVAKRYICVPCFNGMKSLTRMRVRSTRRVRNPFVEAAIQAYLTKH